MTKVTEVQVKESPALKQNGTKMKPDERIEVFEEMTIKDVEENGSEAQKIVAAAFDTIEEEFDYKKGDGKFDKAEAMDLNSYRFALDKNKKELRAYNTASGSNVTIKYNNLQELKKEAGLIHHSSDLTGGNITFDLRNKTALYEDVSGFSIDIPSKGFDTCTIRNANLSGINAYYYEGQLALENVADVGILWDSKTEVNLSAKGTIKVDADSKIDIYRAEE